MVTDKYTTYSGTDFTMKFAHVDKRHRWLFLMQRYYSVAPFNVKWPETAKRSI